MEYLFLYLWVGVATVFIGRFLNDMKISLMCYLIGIVFWPLIVCHYFVEVLNSIEI